MVQSPNRVFAALALTLAAAAALLPGCGSSEHGASPGTTASPATPSAPSAPTTAPSAPTTAPITPTTAIGPAPTVPGEPAAFVAVAGDGRLVVASPSTGQVTRTLGAAQPSIVPPLGLSADRHTVWFARVEGACASSLVRVPLAGGNEVRAPGTGGGQADSAPTPAPDGMLVAFSRHSCPPLDGQVVIGPAASLSQPTSVLNGIRAGALSWSPDGTILAVESPAPDRVQLVTASKTGAHKTVPAPDPGCTIDHPVFEPVRPVLLVAEACPGRGRILELDPGSGAVRHALANLANAAVASTFSLDGTGRFLLYSTGGSGAESLWYLDLSAPAPAPVPIPNGAACRYAMW